MKYLKILFLVNIILIINSNLQAKNNFISEGKILFENKKYSEAKFKFEKEIVYNPKNENAYLYLAKIFNKEKNKKFRRK